jgi:RNA polymerase sigma-70 factor (ECF subfamily)
LKLISLHKNYRSLIAKSVENDRRAQQQLFELFSPKMLSVCRKYMKSTDRAEEVMITGFFKVFTNLKSFKAEGSFEGWIRRIMVNQCLSQLRKEKKLNFDDTSEIENSIRHVSYQETSFEVAEIQKFIDALPNGYKTVFVLHVIEGYKHSEISELLKISESTSKTQLFKARKQLQKQITEQQKHKVWGPLNLKSTAERS